MPADTPLPLRIATVQDIQLELIRRSQFNAMDGEQVFASLIRHRDLWTAALLDRPGVPNFERPGLAMSGLIKLRDLPHNVWNTDTLFLLTASREKAAELARIIESEDWAGELQAHDDQREIDSALGVGRQPGGLVSVWWD